MNTDHPPHTPPAPGLSYRLMHAMIWPITRALGLSCRDFAILCTQELDRPLTASENFRRKLHGLMCGLCRPLPKQFSTLKYLVQCGDQDGADKDSPSTSLDSDATIRIASALAKAAGKPQDPDV